MKNFHVFDEWLRPSGILRLVEKCQMKRSFGNRFMPAMVWLVSLLVLNTATLASAAVDSFEQSVLPVLRDHCITCHSTEKQEGELDLQRFATLAEVKRQPDVWIRVQEQLAIGEMPPKEAKQLSSEQKQRLASWVRETLNEIALDSAGDPGPVVLRRLSNMEYTYTLRDLTGIKSLDPAREFPVDGAAGEGFTNAGAALVMSPALLAKYLEAAKEVAAHAVFTPHGLRWSASTSSRDWTDEALSRIRSIYARYTTTGDASQTVAQGIKLDTGTGDGRLPLAKYLEAIQGRASVEGLSPKYLQTLQRALSSENPSLLLDPLRKKYRDKQLTVEDIAAWQKALWRFTNVGHIGKENGPKAWQEPVSPLVSKQEMRMKLTGERDTILYLTTTDAGDGSQEDQVIWENPRLVAPGRPDLPISSLSSLVKHLESQRTKLVDNTVACLNAIATGKDDEVDPSLLAAWREYLGYSSTKLEPLLTKKMQRSPDYEFIKGWTGDNALSVLANSSDVQVRIPGVMKPRSVATHPSPTRSSIIAWSSPKAGLLRVEGDITHVHSECGNGVTWALEVRRGQTSEILTKGETKGGTTFKMGPFENVRVEAGQVIAVVIGPKEGNHSCDLTAVNLTLHDGTETWDLAKDVSPDILAGNPNGPWHFLSQPATLGPAPDVPAPIAAWRNAPSPELATRVKQFLENEFPLNSPLLRPFLAYRPDTSPPADLLAAAPSTLEVHIPALLADGAEFVVSGRLRSKTAGSVQMQILTTKPENMVSLVAGKSETGSKPGQWSDNNLVTQYSTPIIVNDSSEARVRMEAEFDEFRKLFPISLCYPRIVPVDEVVTLTLYYREDEHLRRLMLSDDEARELDRAWEELLFVSEAPLKQVDAFEQIWQFATQDARPEAFEPMRQPIMQAAAAFKEQRKASVEVQRAAVLDFAERAWRRPLTDEEVNDLRRFDPRLMMVRVLTSPAFLYRGETARDATGPVSSQELATRISYFLWSSAPDDELRSANLLDQEVLVAQVRRMLKSDKVRRLALEFGCQWLHVRDVATLNEKSERHFPTFIDLRDDMQEEVTRFFTDLIQNDRSVLNVLDADYTFLNQPLADHYGIPLVGTDWQRVDGVRKYGRGGALGFAATLAKQSGASRTSAILRGTWVSEVLLGDRIPNPPKGVPTLPEEPPAGLSERQLIEFHSSDERCATCHKRIDPYGFALEGFDAIGRSRPADTKTVVFDGTTVEGIEGLRRYVASNRRSDFLRQFSRKLLGYALGRSIQLSDQPLIDQLTAIEGERINKMIELIVRSPQFREIRGADSRL